MEKDPTFSGEYIEDVSECDGFKYGDKQVLHSDEEYAEAQRKKQKKD